MGPSYFVYMLIIALSGQPVGIAKDPTPYPTEGACTAVAMQVATDMQAKIDTDPNLEVRGRFAVAKVACATEDEMAKARSNAAAQDSK